MYGAILGDIIGSYYEYNEFISKNIDLNKRLEILNYNTPLFKDTSKITDDSILTIAIADALINNVSFEIKLKEHANKYLKNVSKTVGYFDNPFSPGFIKWVNGNFQGESIGNGAAMRISSIGYFYDNLKEVLIESKKATECSHNSEQAINGAQAIASSIFLLRNGFSKKELKKYIIDKYKYNLDLELLILQKTNTFKTDCNNTVPLAIFIFLQSNSFEDSIRKAISIGGDTDTIACITGSIAEAYYGVSDVLKNKADNYLDDNQKEIINKFYNYKINIKQKTF
jgi:ADP-ribosyl-[dinitrogen reductase] hydrolase